MCTHADAVPVAAAAATGISFPLRLGKRARNLRVSSPDWVLLDCFIRHLSREDEDSSCATLAYELTSTGDLIGVSFSAAPPPGLAHLIFDWCPNARKKAGRGFRSRRGNGRKDSSPWFPHAANAVAAHGNLILLRFLLLTKCGLSEEFFVYEAGPQMTLTRLTTCGHTFMDGNIGILCREGGGEFAVAHLAVALKEGDSDLWGACPVTAQLCCMLSQDGSWRTKWLPIRYGEGKGMDLSWWESDVVVPFGDSICWVDYLSGICDVFSPNPELQYVPLPVNAYEGRRHPELGDRGTLSAFRSVCVTEDGDAIKFIDASTSNLWFYGCPDQSSAPSNITSWTLSNDRLTWKQDGIIEVDKFFALATCLDLPPMQPKFPLVDMKDPQTIYFTLTTDGLCSVTANMLTKTLGRPTSYLQRSSLSSGKGDGYTSSCNIFHSEPFLPCEFSKYLGPYAPDTRGKKTTE